MGPRHVAIRAARLVNYGGIVYGSGTSFRSDYRHEIENSNTALTFTLSWEKLRHLLMQANVSAGSRMGATGRYLLAWPVAGLSQGSMPVCSLFLFGSTSKAADGSQPWTENDSSRN